MGLKTPALPQPSAGHQHHLHTHHPRQCHRATARGTGGRQLSRRACSVRSHRTYRCPHRRILIRATPVRIATVAAGWGRSKRAADGHCGHRARHAAAAAARRVRRWPGPGMGMGGGRRTALGGRSAYDRGQGRVAADGGIYSSGGAGQLRGMVPLHGSPIRLPSRVHGVGGSCPPPLGLW